MGAANASTINTGSYMRVLFSGNTASLAFDVSNMVSPPSQIVRAVGVSRSLSRNSCGIADCTCGNTCAILTCASSPLLFYSHHPLLIAPLLSTGGSTKAR